jgi:thioesterase domain-containing protein
VLVNGLGATECGIVRQFFVDHDTPVPAATVPIGYPVEDMHVVLVDDTGHDVASGRVGEIVVKSRYLALGYWRDAELTAAAFSEETDGLRSYRTGDLGRLREDGCLEHLGRKDFQLKVGGHRIEAAEIDSALLEMEGVKEAAVATCQGPGDEPRLVAYIVPTAPPGPTVSAIRRRLAGRLPSFMVPSAYVTLDALPLNANAKVDRRALPAPTGHRPLLDVPCDAPGTLLQQQLVPIWETLLGVSPVGIRDDFFDLGGSSLLAHRMIAEVERLVGRRISHSAMLAGSTIERLAAAIQDETDHPDRVVEVQGGGPRPPFFFLHGDYLGGFYCAELARRIGADQPFYALPPYGLDGGPIPASYAAMAEGHVAALRAICPKGPYRLGGLCNGGLVALEMARRIVREGEQVDRLILIAASALNVRWRPTQGPIGMLGWWIRRGSSERFDRFIRLVCRWDSLDGPARARLALRTLARALRRDARSAAARPPATAGIPESRRQMRAAYRRLDKDYTPAPYQGPLTVLWPDEDIERVNAEYWWSTVAKDLNFRLVPGTHDTCVTLYVDALAGEVRRCLADEPPDSRPTRCENQP